jgi:glucosamine kinase
LRVFAGVEGGATRNTALLMDETGAPLVRVESVPVLIREATADAVVSAIADLVERARAQAGGAPLAALCCALTGVGREAERAAVRQALEVRALASHARLVTDAEAALQDAFGAGPGIVLIAGTGSVAWGRGPDGRTERAGGWGPLLGDEGSGYAIGLAALRAVAATHDGLAPPTTLTGMLLEATGRERPPDLIRWADHASRADIAALAAIVQQQAEQDLTAGRIMAAAADSLAALVTALERRLGPWPAGTEVAFAGGLLAGDRPLRQAVTARLSTGAGARRVLARDVDGARGAAALARAFHEEVSRARGQVRP